MTYKNLTTKIKETYNKAGFVGALGISTLMIPINSFVHNALRGHTDLETITSRTIGTILTLTAAPPMFKFIDWSSKKLKIKENSVQQKIYLFGLSILFILLFKGISNYVSLYKSNSIPTITYTVMYDSLPALAVFPFAKDIKDLANDLIGNYKFSKIPKWIKEKTQKQKRRLAYVAVGLSMLITSAIYVATPSKEPNEVINKRPETENVAIKYAQTQNLYK